MSAPQTMPNGTQDVGGQCWLHGIAYTVVQGDEVCPRCLDDKERELTWRDTEDSNYTSGDDLGDIDEE